MSAASGKENKPSSSRSRRDKDDTTNPDINIASIGNYAFQKTVGEGNFAKVKLAKHKLTGVEVAVKVIDKTTLDEKKLAKLYREVRIMKLLHHPHIVKLYEVIETKSTVFLVMEYASGGELYDYLVVHGKMKEKEARAKFRQILSAVSYCHKKRVIHRDLKAENLLLDSNLDIKIADFGFSNYYDPDSKLDTFCGSPPYAAPELFQGRRYTGPEVDIWSLGVILYVLTTGCLPFDGKNLQEMRESVCRGKYRIPFYLSDSCEKLLRKFLIRDPYKRAGLEMLIDDPWINEGYDHSPISTDVSQRVDEDDAIIALMERKYKIDRESIIKGLRENVYDETTAIYYLLYYEKDMRAQLAIEVAGMPAAAPLPSPAPTITQMESPISPTHGRESSAMGSKPLMMRIDEDGVLPSPAQPPAGAPATGGEIAAAQSRKPAVQTKPRKRRFTVGGEADMAKFADEDEEGADALKKVQHKEEGQQPSIGVPLPMRGGGDGTPLPAIVGSNHKISPQNSAIQINAAANANSTAGTPTSPETGDRPQRKRHNTIVGILRNQLRRQSETTMSPIYPVADRGTDTVNASGISGNMPTIASNSGAAITHDVISSTSPLPHGAEDEPVKTDDNKPRSLRFTFNSNTTSGKPPDDIISEVAAACDSHGIGHRLASRFLIECFCQPAGAGKDALKFEIEVCKLPRLKNLHGLRFKRVAGSSADYKDICEKILVTVVL
ncbi:Serine/threonine-protein kinase par-1 [Rhizophlyctis rosea]|uniref:non-specific serine/threonine protein kinase n=1 Tax=Rhizophlyctis rosea TaxID=64517 RepID=A0AAD5X5Y7_9FUNG|nr:Serine/threonine-protein kinase par-1 [Rhizophlyctis rosea]